MTERSAAPPPWEIESSELLHEYDVYGVRRDRARSPRTGEVHDFHVVAAPDGVVVLALTREEELVLVEQYRHGTREVSLELPAGIVDDDEDPCAAAGRELREETGYVGGEGRRLGTLDLNPSWETTRVHVVVVHDAARVREREQDAGEDIRVRTLPVGAALEEVREGRIRSAVAVAALHLLSRWQENRMGRSPSG